MYCLESNTQFIFKFECFCGSQHAKPVIAVAACYRSQQLAELLDLPTDGMSADPSTPKGQQTSYNGVYILQHRQDAEAPKMSRFGTRDQVRTAPPVMLDVQFL